MEDIKKVDFSKRGSFVLSPLQSDILDILWRNGDSTVRNMYNILKTKRKVALTSIAVDSDRMHKKGFVGRSIKTGLGGPHYIYSAKKTKEEFQKSILDTTVNKLIEKFGEVAVDYFNKRFRGKR